MSSPAALVRRKKRGRRGGYDGIRSIRLGGVRGGEGWEQMLAERDATVAREIKHRVSSIVGVLDLVVFGSRARGDASWDSDLDVFLLVEKVTPAIRRRISESAWEVGFDHDRVVSTVVADPSDMEGAFGANPLVRAIRSEGVRP